MMAEMRLIDATALRIANITERKHIFIDGKRRSAFVYGEVVRIKDLQNAPTIDAVPVVRCPDCKYSSPKHHFDIFEWVYCKKWNTEIKKNDFCSYGERKADGNET